MGDAWLQLLQADPRPWLLEEADPAVRAQGLVRLLGRSADDGEVLVARAEAMRADPIKGILDAMDPRGFWVKPGPGYAPKYSGTVWNLMFLEQMGADPSDDRVQAACRYVLDHTTVATGGFDCTGSHLERRTRPSSVLHCLNGNLTRALVVFGHLDDPRVQAAVGWAARTITGEDVARWYAYTPGPGFICGVNEDLPCAWGAAKEMRALAAIPPRRRTTQVKRAIAQGVEFLLSRDPAAADYPMGWGNTKPSTAWFKLGFPLGYTADVLQVLEVLTELGRARDPRLQRAVSWVAGLADAQGRWVNRYAYPGKTTAPIEAQGKPSKWVTLRACTVLRAAG